jgi:hypothetical protein
MNTIFLNEYFFTICQRWLSLTLAGWLNLFIICLRWLSLALAGLHIKTQHIEDIDGYDFPEEMCFYNVSAPAFAGLGWLAYVNGTY